MTGFIEDRGLIKAAQDFRQLQQELTGASGGRMLRFLTPEMAERLRADLRAEKRQAYYSALMMRLLTDAQYRETYEWVWSKLEEYERRAEQALERIRQRMADLETRLDDLRSRAARSPDGTRIYRDQMGAVRAEDGTEITGPALEAVIWPETPVSNEEISAPREELAALAGDEKAVVRYQVEVLGEAKNRLEDQEDPLSIEELKELDLNLETAAPSALLAFESDANRLS